MNTQKTVLILGANSDVAKQAIRLYIDKGYFVILASRNLKSLQNFEISLNGNSGSIGQVAGTPSMNKFEIII